MFDMHGETVCYNEKDETAVIIDQTLLPGEIVTLELWEKEEMYDAIKRLAVRGAPAIGVFAAIGLSVLTARDKTADEKTLIEHFLENLEYLTSSRPTAGQSGSVFYRRKPARVAVGQNTVAVFEKICSVFTDFTAHLDIFAM